MSETQNTSTTAVALDASTLPLLDISSINTKVASETELSAEEIERARKIAADLKFEDGNSIGLFASASMQKFNQTLSEMLSGTTIKDAGSAGDIALEVTQAMGTMRLKEMKAELGKSGWSWLRTKIPFFGKYLSMMHLFVERRKQFEDLTQNLERNARKRLREILEYLLKSEQLISAVEAQYKELAVFIVASEYALERGRREYDELRERAKSSTDALLFARIDTMRENLEAFDVRALRIKIAYGEAPANAKMIRMSQVAGRTAINNVMNTLDFTMPKIKTLVINLAGLHKINESETERRKIEKLNDELGTLSKDLVSKTYLAAKSSQGEALDQVNKLTEFMTTIANAAREGIEIEKVNAEKRAEAEKKLLQTMQTFKQSLDGMQDAPFRDTPVSGSFPRG